MWFIILMLVFITPIGIGLIIRNTKLSKIIKIIITIIFIVWLFFLSAFYYALYGFIVNPHKNQTPIQNKPTVEVKVSNDTHSTKNEKTDTTPIKNVNHDTTTNHSEQKQTNTSVKNTVSTSSNQTKNQTETNQDKQQTNTNQAQNQNNNNNNGGESTFNPNGTVKQLGNGYDHAKLHSSASSSSSGYDLSPGTQVQILGESNEFYYVELQNGSTGYIYAPFVARNNGV